MASVGAFYKRIDQPIERIVVSLAGTPATSFDNSDRAQLYGFEWELHKDFSFISDELMDLMLYLNASWIGSRADRGARNANETSNLLSSSRSLQGQAPFVINTTIQYSSDDWGVFRVLYNTKGETLSSLGDTGLPDIFEARRDQLDFVWTHDVEILDWPISLRFSVKNLLNDRYLWTQAGITQKRFKTGLTFGLAGSYRW